MRKELRISFRFEPRDLWFGVFIGPVEWRGLGAPIRTRMVYMCIIPCFPIVLEFVG